MMNGLVRRYQMSDSNLLFAYVKNRTRPSRAVKSAGRVVTCKSAVS